MQKRPAKPKTKAERLAAALKENLRRRKAQARARSAPAAAASSPDPSGPKDAGNHG